MKISFTGDLTCDLPLLKAAYKQKTYNFDNVFVRVSELFKDSQYVVTNLETTFSERGNYNKKAYCYNSPEEFLDAAIKAGINVYGVANNHCCDGGLAGLKRTIKVIEARNMMYMGYQGRNCSVDCDGRKVTFLAYTYGINNNGYDLGQIDKVVNLLKPYNGHPDVGIKKLISMPLRRRIRKSLRVLAGKPTLEKSIDSYVINKAYCEQICEDIRKAKESSDYVVVCSHMGGQFNLEVGSFSRSMAECFANAGADLVIGNHAHIVQAFECVSVPTFFSLGGFSLSPSASYLITDDMPQYSVIVHLYFENDITKLTFSIVKCVEDTTGYVTVWPVDQLYEQLEELHEREELKKECAMIYNRLLSANTKCENFELKREFIIRGDSNDE